MIAVARQRRTSEDTSADEVREGERDELQKVDALREIGLRNDILEDDLKDPLRKFGAAAMLPIARLQRIAEIVTFDGAGGAPAGVEEECICGGCEEEAQEEKVEPEQDVVPDGPQVTPEPPTPPTPPPTPPADEPEVPPEPQDKQDNVPGGDATPDLPPPLPPPLPLPEMPAPPPMPLPPGDTSDAVDVYKDMPPSSKAAQVEVFAGQVTERGKGEQKGVQEGMPTCHVELKDQTPLPPGKTLEPDGKPSVPVPGQRADVDTGATGNVPKPKLQAPAPRGGFRAPVAPQIKAQPGDEGVSGADVKRALIAIPKSDTGLPKSPGAPPKLPLAGDADPNRAHKAAASGLDQAGRAQAEAAKEVVEAKGVELITPEVFYEEFKAGEVKVEELEKPPVIDDAVKYTQLGLGADVQAKFDEMYGGQMQESVAPLAAQVKAATEARDQQVKDELAAEHAKGEALHADAQSQQDALITEQRSAIQDKKSETIAAQQKEVGALHKEAMAEKAKLGATIDQRVQQDEALIAKHYADAESKAAAEIAAGEKKAQAAKQEADQKSGEKSWWEKAVDAVADFVEKVAAAVTEIFDAVRAVVASILDAVVKIASNVIDAATKFICDALSFFGEWLTRAINALLAEAFPRLARALVAFVDQAVQLAKASVLKIANALKAAVAKLCQWVLNAIDTVIAVWRHTVALATATLQGLLTGDWSALGKKVLEAVLSVLGIDPGEFYAMVGSAEETIDTIVNSPDVFVGNAIDAARLGFQNFADNFMDHLQKGFVNWLMGELGDIKIPEELDGAGVLDLVLQVAGVGPQQLRTKAVKIVGEKNVERVELVWGLITDLLDDSEGKEGSGLKGLWGAMEEHVGNLWDDVIGNIQSWLMQRVVTQAVLKLATMFNPVGAILQLVMTAWNLYNFLRENTQRIWGVVTAWVASLGDIAQGKLDGAAKGIEGALAGLVPVAISLLANLVGLRGVAQKVKQVIDGVQAKIDKAIDKVIEKFLSLLPKGKDDGKGEQDGGGAFAGTLPKGEIGKYAQGGAHTYKLADLEITADYELEIANRQIAGQRYKQAGQKGYDVEKIHNDARSYLRVVLHKDIGDPAAEAVFAVVGQHAYANFGRQAKDYLAQKMHPYGLRVSSVKVQGKAPQGKTGQEMWDAAKDKAIDAAGALKEKVFGKAGDKAPGQPFEFGWDEPKTRERLLERVKFGGRLESESLTIEVGGGDLWIGIGGPTGRLNTQMGVWLGQLSSLKDSESHQARNALSEARRLLPKLSPLKRKLLYLKENDEQKQVERIKTADQLIALLGELAVPLSVVYRAFNGYGVEGARSEEQTRRDKEREAAERDKGDKDAYKDAGKQLLDLLAATTLPAKDAPARFKGYGWQYADAAAILAAAGTVTLLGHDFPVMVELAGSRLDVKIHGIGFLGGVAALWSVYRPDGAEALAAVNGGLAKLKGAHNRFHESASHLGTMLGDEPDEAAKRTAAAAEVAARATEAASVCAEIAAVAGLPSALGVLAETRMTTDHTAAQAGWTFNESKHLFAKQWQVQIGVVSHAITTQVIDGRLVLVIDGLGPVTSMLNAWQASVASQQDPAGLEKLLAQLRNDLTYQAHFSDELRKLVDLTPDAAARRVDAVNKWLKDAALTVATINQIGSRFGAPPSERRAVEPFQDVEVKLAGEATAMKVVSGQGGYSLEVPGHGNVRDLVVAYAARLDREQATDPTGASVKAFAAAHAALQAALDAFDAASRALVNAPADLLDATFRALRRDLAAAAIKVGEALAALWRAHGAPGEVGEQTSQPEPSEPQSEAVSETEAATQGGQTAAPTPAVKDVKPVRGWDFKIARKYLKAMKVKLRGGKTVLSVTLTTDPPIPFLGKFGKSAADYAGDLVVEGKKNRSRLRKARRRLMSALTRFKATMSALGPVVGGGRKAERRRKALAKQARSRLKLVRTRLQQIPRIARRSDEPKPKPKPKRKAKPKSKKRLSIRIFGRTIKLR